MSTETNFTPGPWEYDGGAQIVEAARPHMRVAFLPSDHAEYAASSHNARLISAAPELYEALENLVEYCQAHHPSIYLVEQIAALKKARGES